MEYEIIDEERSKRIRYDSMTAYETRCFYTVVYTKEQPLKDEKVESPNVSDDDDSSSDDDDRTCDHLSVKDFYMAYIARSPEQCASELAAPQRSLEWLNARRYAITASNFGSAVGHNSYQSPEALVHDKLWNSFCGNAFTQYGTFHETDAAESLKLALNNQLRQTLETIYTLETIHNKPNIQNVMDASLDSWTLMEFGLIKHHEQPWMAVSPDGILVLKGSHGNVSILVEYKCPARLRDSDGHPYAKQPHNVPPYYMDQMQGIMGFFNKFPDLT
jgi:hypothetical protein